MLSVRDAGRAAEEDASDPAGASLIHASELVRLRTLDTPPLTAIKGPIVPRHEITKA